MNEQKQNEAIAKSMLKNVLGSSSKKKEAAPLVVSSPKRRANTSAGQDTLFTSKPKPKDWVDRKARKTWVKSITKINPDLDDLACAVGDFRHTFSGVPEGQWGLMKDGGRFMLMDPDGVVVFETEVLGEMRIELVIRASEINGKATVAPKGMGGRFTESLSEFVKDKDNLVLNDTLPPSMKDKTPGPVKVSMPVEANIPDFLVRGDAFKPKWRWEVHTGAANGSGNGGHQKIMSSSDWWLVYRDELAWCPKSKGTVTKLVMTGEAWDNDVADYNLIEEPVTYMLADYEAWCKENGGTP